MDEKARRGKVYFITIVCFLIGIMVYGLLTNLKDMNFLSFGIGAGSIVILAALSIIAYKGYKWAKSILAFYYLLVSVYIFIAYFFTWFNSGDKLTFNIFIYLLSIVVIIVLSYTLKNSKYISMFLDYQRSKFILTHNRRL